LYAFCRLADDAIEQSPKDADILTEWLSGLRGARVALRVPQRGDKRSLADTVARNAAEAFAQHKLRRASDHNARARALTALQDALALPEAPLRIECFDISNLQGTDIVGSMVVLEDGLGGEDHVVQRAVGAANVDAFGGDRDPGQGPNERHLRRGQLSAVLEERVRKVGHAVGDGDVRRGRNADQSRERLVDANPPAARVLRQRSRDRQAVQDGLEIGGTVVKFYNRYLPGHAPYMPTGTALAAHPAGQRRLLHPVG